MAIALAGAPMLGLSAIAAATVGAGFDVQGTQTYGIQVVLGGTVAPTGVTVLLQGTVDPPTVLDANANWFTMTTWAISTPQTSGDILFAANKPVRRIRANCTVLTGGTLPTATAKMSAV